MKERTQYSEGFRLLGPNGFALLSRHLLGKLSDCWRNYETVLLKEMFAIVGGSFIPHVCAPDSNAGALILNAGASIRDAGASTRGTTGGIVARRAGKP